MTSSLDVYRRNEADWDPIGGTTYPSDYFVAAPLTGDRAANLYTVTSSHGPAPTRSEFYRLLITTG